MNICFFYSHPLFQAKGGTERVSILLRDEFERRGHSVSFLAFAENQASVENFAQFYIKKETAQSGLESFVREKKINFFIYQDGAVPIPFEIPQNLGCRLVVVLHYSPDFYTNDYWKIFLEARLPRPLKFLAAFFEKTLLNSLGLALLRRRIGWVYAASLRSCSAFVLLSERFCPDLEKLLGKSVPTDAHKKIHAIPNPSVPASLPQGTSKKKELLFVGRLKNN